MKICSNVPGHMTKMASRPIYMHVKTFKNLLLRNQEADNLETCIQQRVLKYYQIIQMMTLGWPWLFLWHGQICFLMLLHGLPLIQHIVMYFQACFNSAYPMHSGERFRTSGVRFSLSRKLFDLKYWLFIFLLNIFLLPYSFHKDILMVRAVKDVKSGDEIFNCYGKCKKIRCRFIKTETACF